jgi:DNA polymerase-3 subunit epsilon
MPLRPIFYDTETTGIDSSKEKIIELAAYDPILNKTFSTLINPEMPIPKETTEIHHITDDMVKEAPKFHEIIPSWIEFCQGETLLIAHNNDGFDILFLQAEFQRSKVSMPSWTFLDSLKWARRYRNDLPRHSLQYLRQIYDIPANDAHRALNDVVILHQVFMKMIDDLSYDVVYQLYKTKKDERNSPSSGPISTMPFGKHAGQPLEKVPKNYVEWLNKSGAFDKEENKALKLAFDKLGLLAQAKIGGKT